MSEQSQNDLLVIVLAVFFLVLGGLVFKLALGKYQRVSGAYVEISILVTMTVVAVVFGVGVLAWWCSTLCFAPGAWRNLTFYFGYSLLQSTLGRAGIYFLTRIIEKWFHL